MPLHLINDSYLHLGGNFTVVGERLSMQLTEIIDHIEIFLILALS